MSPAFWIALLILLVAIFLRKTFHINEKEGFVNYVIYGPGKGQWYGGRRYYKPHWGYRHHWWDNLYEPAPWGPCPGAWCPYS